MHVKEQGLRQQRLASDVVGALFRRIKAEKYFELKTMYPDRVTLGNDGRGNEIEDYTGPFDDIGYWELTVEIRGLSATVVFDHTSPDQLLRIKDDVYETSGVRGWVEGR